jgi:DNA-binding Lrp family transcriptional regulator
VEAYVLIQTEAGRRPIAHRLRAIPGVMAAEDLTGAFDAIARARTGSGGRPVEEIVGEIARLPGVTRALPAPLT